MPKYKTISMSELAKNAERIATEIDSARTLYRIKRPGQRTLVLIDEAELEIARLAVMGRAHLAVEAAGPGITLEAYLQERGLDEDGRPSSHRKQAARPATSARALKDARRSARSRARAS